MFKLVFDQYFSIGLDSLDIYFGLSLRGVKNTWSPGGSLDTRGEVNLL